MSKRKGTPEPKGCRGFSVYSGSLSRVGVNLFLRHRDDVPVSLYVKDRKIRFLKFSKFRYPKAFRLITLMALFVPSVKPLV